MNKKPPKDATTAPVKSPTDWEHAKPKSFEALAKEYPEWFQKLTQGLGYEFEWRATTSPRVSLKQQHATYVILSAQLRHWKQAAKDSAKQLNEDGLAHTISETELADALSENEREEAVEMKRPKFGGHLTEGYMWLSERHPLPDLRRALGCSPNVFQTLRKAAKIPSAERKGQNREFTFKEAMLLLRVRLSRKRPNAKRRCEIAEEIWDYVVSHTFQPVARRNQLREILTDAGAACKQPTTAQSTRDGKIFGQAGDIPRTRDFAQKAYIEREGRR